MSGWANQSGVAYQQARAILACLDALDGAYGAVAEICVESAVDEFDLEMVDTSRNLLVAQQIKTRQLSQTWTPSEILGIIHSFASRDDGGTELHIVLGGRLGPTGQRLQSALEEARVNRNTRLLVDFAGDELDEDVAKTSLRSQLVVDPTPTSSLLNSARSQTIAHLSTPGFDAVDEAEAIVNRLYLLITDRASQPDSRDRFIKLEEIRAAFKGGFIERTGNWNSDTRSAYLQEILDRRAAETVQADLQYLRTPIERATAASPRQADISDLLDGKVHEVSLISGQSGSGKSTLATSARRVAALDANPVAVADAQRYVPGRLSYLVSNELAAILGSEASIQLGRGFLSDPESTLFLDSVSEIPNGVRRELAAEINHVMNSRRHCRLILVGRDAALLNSVPPTNAERQAFQLNGVVPEGQRELVARVLADVNDGDPGDSVYGVLERIRYALGSATSVPYLLTMAAELVKRGFDIKGRAQMYTIFTQEMARAKGIVDLQICLLGLGIAFSKLLNSGTRQCDQFDWNDLLNNASETLALRNISLPAEQLRDVALRGGFVSYEDWDQTVRPAHDSLADFFSALAMSKNLIDLPATATSNDYLRLRFFAEVSGLTDDLGSLVCRDLPFKSAQLADLDTGRLANAAPEAATEFCRTLMPEILDSGISVKIATDTNRSIVTIGRSPASYVNISEVVAISAGIGVIEFQGGPFSAAERLWRTHLDTVLTSASFPGRIPDSAETAAAEVRNHLARTQLAIVEVVDQAVRADLRAAVLDAAIPEPSALFILRARGQKEPHWPVLMQRASETTVSLCANFDDVDDESRLGWSSVDSILRKSPRQTACELVRTALNELAEHPWL